MIYFQYIVISPHGPSNYANTINEHAKAAGLGLYFSVDSDKVQRAALTEIAELLSKVPVLVRIRQNLQIILTEGEFDHE